MRYVRIALVIFAVLAPASAFARGPFGSIHVGHWGGGAYTSDTTGAFTHCAAGASYRNGNYLIVARNVEGNWSIGFANPAFNLRVGESIPIEVTFDGANPHRLYTSAITNKLISAIMPASVVHAFRKADIMTVQAKNAVFQFKLASTDRLIPVIANCVAKTKIAGISNVGDFTVPASNTHAEKKPLKALPAGTLKREKLLPQNGTGIVISTDGYVVTNYHVVNGCVGDITGNLTGKAGEKLRIVSTDEINDLALLQVSKTFAKVAKIRATAVRSGDQIIAIGYPYHGLLTSDFTVTTGIISSLSGLLNDTRYLQISAPIQPGNSGGPLLDSSGYLVGVVAAKINALKFAKATGDLPENINFAIKTGAVRDFLDNSVVNYQTGDSTAELKTAEIAQSARAFTMLISCQAKETK